MLQNRKSAVNFCLVLIVLLGAFLRIHTATNTVVDAPLRADAGQYYSYAYNLPCAHQATRYFFWHLLKNLPPSKEFFR